jgi:AraC-like DNA-binding protein
VQQRVMDRLGEEELCRLASEFRAGVTVRELAERFGMSGSTVKRILRKQGVRRNMPAGVDPLFASGGPTDDHRSKRGTRWLQCGRSPTRDHGPCGEPSRSRRVESWR